MHSIRRKNVPKIKYFYIEINEAASNGDLTSFETNESRIRRPTDEKVYRFFEGRFWMRFILEELWIMKKKACSIDFISCFLNRKRSACNLFWKNSGFFRSDGGYCSSDIIPGGMTDLFRLNCFPCRAVLAR